MWESFFKLLTPVYIAWKDAFFSVRSLKPTRFSLKWYLSCFHSVSLYTLNGAGEKMFLFFFSFSNRVLWKWVNLVRNFLMQKCFLSFVTLFCFCFVRFCMQVKSMWRVRFLHTIEIYMCTVNHKWNAMDDKNDAVDILLHFSENVVRFMTLWNLWPGNQRFACARSSSDSHEALNLKH